MNPTFREDMYAERVDCYLASIRAATAMLQARGTKVLPANLTFFMGMPEELADSEDSDSDVAFDVGIGETWTMRLVTFDGYFKIEDRVHGVSQVCSCGTDFWCSARCISQAQGMCQFEARVWLVVQRGFEMGEPHAFFKPPSARYFQLSWNEAREVEIAGFHAFELLASVGGDPRLISPIVSNPNSSLLQVGAHFQIPHYMVKLVDGPQAFAMLGDVHTGTHYSVEDLDEGSSMALTADLCVERIQTLGCVEKEGNLVLKKVDFQ
mmetsp:Transcript_59248/g.108893  ORF Transcript_59248/g.108893 Transcript_59248/m.108893 type:complete len:265 (+) Transcript_59248:1-795(+)